MTCQVTKFTGKEGKTFKSLTEKFGQRAALRKIFEGDDSEGIFTSPMEKAKRVNAVAYRVFQHIKARANSNELFNIDVTQIKVSDLGDILDRTFEDFFNHGSELLTYAENNPEYAESYTTAAERTQVVLDSFGEILPDVMKKLNAFGYKVSDTVLDLIEKEELSEEHDKEHIYDKNFMENSRKDSLSRPVKMYISSLPQYELNEETGEYEEALDDISMVQPSDFNAIYSSLALNLAGSRSFEEMITRIKGLEETNPVFGKIAQDLESGVLDSNSTVKVNGQKVTNFANAFYTSFANNYSNLITVTKNTREVPKDREDPTAGKDRKADFRVIETNRRKLPKLLRVKWAQANLAVSKIANTDRLDVLKDRKELNKTRYNANVMKRLNDLRDTDVFKTLIEDFKEIGIGVDYEALIAWRKEHMARNKAKKFSEILYSDANSVYKNLIYGFWSGKDVFGQLGELSAEAEGTSLNTLTKYQAMVETDRSVGAFMNGEGSLIHPVNLHNHVTSLVSRFKQKDGDLQMYVEDPMMGSLRMVKSFNSPIGEKMQLASFDTMYDNDSTRDGIAFDSLDPVTSLSTKINMFQNFVGKKESEMGWFFVPTPADRGNSLMMKLPKITGTSFDSHHNLSDKSQFKQWLIDTVNAEYERIVTVREEFADKDFDGEYITNYHVDPKTGGLGNGGYFNLYPELNQFLTPDENGLVTRESFEAESVWDYIEELVHGQIENSKTYLEQKGLININTDGTIDAAETAKGMFHEVGRGAAISKSVVENFVANNIVALYEMSTLFSGDMAMYKTSDFTAENTSQTTQFSDLNKRAGLPYTPGQQLRVGTGGSKSSFKVAVMEDVQNESLFIDQYKALLGNKGAKLYESNEIADAQGLISLDRYRDIAAGLGQLTESLNTTIDELKKENPDWTKVTERLQPLKGFYFAHTFHESLGRLTPFNLKYSSLPVIPAMIKDNDTMKSLHQKMVNGKIDEIVFESGVKTGIQKVNSLDSENLAVVTLLNRHWRMPLVVPYKEKVEDNFGSQVRKLITNNLPTDAQFKVGSETVSRENLKRNYQEAMFKNVESSFNKVLKNFKTEGNFDIAKVANIILEELEKNSYKTTPDFYQKALEVIDTEFGKDTRMPLSYPAIKGRVENSLNSMFRKNVTKQKLPGFSAVQYTSLGFTRDVIKIDDSLKFVRLSKNGVELSTAAALPLLEQLKAGKSIPSEYDVLPAEVVVSPQYFIQSLKKKLKGDELKSVMDSITDERGQLVASKIPADLLNGVLYRIPTQAKNSMLPMRIKSFSPESAGSVICIPSEITSQSGSDYDIDKVFIEMLNFDVVDGQMVKTVEGMDTKAARQNTIVSTHYSILTHPSSFKELITTNGADTLKGLRNGLNKIYNASATTNYWNSIELQEDFRDKNKAGKDLIGVSSIANTFHSLAQDLKVALKKDVSINNIVRRSLHNLRSGEFVDITRKPDNFKGFVGGFQNQGKGTEAGDGKDKAMRQIATAAIVELKSQKPSSSLTTLTELGAYQGGQGVIMLARNGGLSGKALTDSTKATIKLGVEQGASFVVGDMPGVDTAFISYLNELGAKYSIYHTGDKARVGAPIKATTFVQENVGNLISDELAEIQTAAVDNAKDPILGELNVNLFTAGSALFLIQAGAGLEFTMKLLNQPIVKELTRQFTAFSAARSEEAALSKALEVINEAQNLDIKPRAPKTDVTLGVLENTLTNYEETGDLSNIMNEQILNSFLYFREIGNELSRVSNALSIDTKGTTSSIAGNIVREEQLKSIHGTYSNQTAEPGSFKEVQYITIDAEAYSNHSNYAFEKYGLVEPTKVLSEFVDDGKPVFRSVVKKLSALSKNGLNEKDLKLLMTDFYTYMFANEDMHVNGKLSAYTNMDNEDRLNLFVGPESLAKRIQEFALEEQELAREDVTYEPNPFIKDLSVEFDNKKSHLDLVAFNNTISQVLTNEEKTMYSDSILDLIEKNEDLVFDLFEYAFTTDGFGTSVNSFMEYLPIELHEEYAHADTEQGVLDFYRELRQDFNSPELFESDQFIDLFIRNNAHKLSFVPRMFGKPSEIKDKLREDPSIKVFIMERNGKHTIGKTIDDAGKYVTSKPVGVANQVKEYHNEDSFLDMYNEFAALNAAKAAKDVEDNNACVI